MKWPMFILVRFVPAGCHWEEVARYNTREGARRGCHAWMESDAMNGHPDTQYGIKMVGDPDTMPPSRVSPPKTKPSWIK